MVKSITFYCSKKYSPSVVAQTLRQMAQVGVLHMDREGAWRTARRPMASTLYSYRLLEILFKDI
jgi:Mn-dependent DtxR family transcriptional regulator